MSEDQYFVYRDEGRLGPYLLDELRDRLRRGDVDTHDRCSLEAGEVFYRVGDILAFEGHEDLDQGGVHEDDGTNALPAGSVPMMGDTDPVRGKVDVAERPPEEVVWKGHPTILSYGKSVVFAILACTVGILAAPLWVAAPLVGISLGLLVLLYAAIERTFRVYLITQLRVEILNGIIARSSKEVRIEDIRAINVDKEGLLGLIGVGTVEFDSAAGGDEAEVQFKSVWGAQRLKKLVRQLQDAS